MNDERIDGNLKRFADATGYGPGFTSYDPLHASRVADDARDAADAEAAWEMAKEAADEEAARYTLGPDAPAEDWSDDDTVTTTEAAARPWSVVRAEGRPPCWLVMDRRDGTIGGRDPSLHRALQVAAELNAGHMERQAGILSDGDLDDAADRLDAAAEWCERPGVSLDAEALAERITKRCQERREAAERELDAEYETALQTLADAIAGRQDAAVRSAWLGAVLLSIAVAAGFVAGWIVKG